MSWDVVGLTADLVRLRTLPGQEEAAVALLQTVMHDLAYDEVRVDETGNLVGTIRGGRRGCLVLDGHLDVVPATDETLWRHPPFEGRIDGDWLYGRGTADTKGSVAAMVLAGGRLAREPRSSRRTVHVSCSLGEEVIEGLAFGRVCDELRPEAVIIGEPTSGCLAIAQRGRAELVVETTGVAGHSAYPQAAVNALEKMVALLPRLLCAPVPPRDDIVGEAILVLTDIISSPFPADSVIPERCRVTIDRRLLPGETIESVLAPLRDAIAAAAGDDRDLRATVDVATVELTTYRGARLRGVKFNPAWALHPASPVVAIARGALRSVGLPADTMSFSACTNGSASAGIRGIPTVGYGPGEVTQAHRVDERVSIAALHRAVAAYAALARELAAAPALGGLGPPDRDRG